jgi:glycosyltransferase involved in cell wall biosynthesis
MFLKDKTPLISVLMPVYNAGKYLRQAINGVLNQTFTDFELVIINDGSTDNSEEIIISYYDNRIVYLKQANQGVARTLNNGLKMCKGKYIRRHDADDISEPYMLENQINFLLQHPDISFVSTQCAFMSNRSKIAYKYRQPKTLIFEGKDYVFAKREHFNHYSPVVHGTVLGPTNIFKEFNGYRTEFLTSEDNDLWLRIIEKYQFAVLNQCPYYLRLSGGSATQMHKSSITYYHQLCLNYANQRFNLGSDPIIRGEKVPSPPINQEDNKPIVPAKGKIFRNDLLDFHYKVMLNAKDWINVYKTIKFAIKDGWRLHQTWKGILFPLLGSKIVALGVKFKKLFK